VTGVVLEEARKVEVGNRTGAGAVVLARDVWQLLRPTQWAKNTVLFAALIFSKHLFVWGDTLRVLAAFVCFCAVASGAYVMNDLRDCARDRQHPLKSRRPLPSGRVPRGAAAVLALTLMGAGLAGALGLGRGFAVLTVGYLLLQVAYTFAFKEMVILDVMAIATGFVIRAAAGGVVIGVPVSPWLIICTFLLALFLGFAKRRHELVLLEGRAEEHRAALREYSPYFLDQMMAVVTASVVVAYASYVASPEVREKLGTDKLYLTIPFVLFGIFRYLYLVHQKEEGGNPTQLLLSDQPLLAGVLLWIVTAALVLYWPA
jgi:4-hydroxybenzoate polyprenyltransferase